MIYAFEDYELDLPRYELRYAGKLVKLEPQVFNVLAYLIQHRDRVITKEELLERLWPGRFVGEATLTSRLTAARRAIGDRGREQRLIQTVHGRGYRFIGPVEERGAEVPGQAERPLLAHDPALPNRLAPPSGRMASKGTQAVGREAEREQLQRCFQRALGGNRQVVFVTGEAGLGKTTLVETFLQEVDGFGALSVGRGQCIEHYGVGEAYLPVLEALGQLCKEPAGQELISLLAKQAPTWLVQMPWLVSGAELDALQRRVMGATQERMLREMAEVIAVVAAERPLILVLEDLHWSDYATLDLIAWLARQQEPARLLVLGTYRPADVRVQGHPLQAVVQELKMHRRGEELALTLLTEGAVEEYLTARFAGNVLPHGLPRLVHQRTEGNPLFMVNVVDAWEAEGWLEEREGEQDPRPGLNELVQGVPESLRQMLLQQFERLGLEEQRVLEAASVAGVECSAAAVAAGLGIDVIEAETWCEGLARRQQWLRAIGSEEWPDGTVAGRYAFIHALYHDVVYQRITAARRIHLHRGIGASKAKAYGPRAGEIAAELAVHFEHGRDYHQAVQYLQRAAETANQRHAQREAIEYLRRALGLLKAMPETPETIRQELEVQLALGPAFMVTKGFAAPEVADTYARARQLCEHLGDHRRLFPVLFGLWRSSHVRAQLQAARALGEQLLSLANCEADPALLVEAHAALGQTLCIRGELTLAREHLHQVVTRYDPQRHTALAFHLGYDPGIYARAVEAWVLWLLGHPEQALQRGREALNLAREQAHPFTLALTLATIAVLRQLRQEAGAALEHVRASVVLSSEHGYPYLRTIGTVRQGWGLATVGQVEEGIAQMRQGLAALRAAGTELLRPYYLALLAEAYGLSGQVEAGLGALEEALMAADQHAERFYEAELHRLKGELLLQQCAGAGLTPAHTEIRTGRAADARPSRWAPLQIEADACFQTALDLAQRQGARSLELRAAMSRYRLWDRLGNGAEARPLLAQVYNRFTEGFDTVDLREARGLLEGPG
ncbi:MAG TPA: AAA family ATPase [Candidatus Tectomicrobia bacterium]|nr:AAA family ATPase [Candidatus Tectomicrobia bacterium]